MTKTGIKRAMYAGEHKVLRFTVVNESEAGEPAFDISGELIRFSLTTFDADFPNQPSLDAPLVDLNSSDDPTQVVITDGPNGLVEVTLLPANTATLADTLVEDKPNRYNMQLEIVTSGTEPIVATDGELTIARNVPNS